MNIKENAISLRSYCESIKDGDSISKKQLDRLYQMIDELIMVIEHDSYDNWPDTPQTKAPDFSTPIRDNDDDDLPF
jgi:hypothetical protein